MAFQDAYAEVLSTSYIKGYYDQVNDSYRYVMQNLLPQGPIWKFEDDSDMVALLEALSYTFYRLELRAQDLLKEFVPETMTELLSDWERVLGLPGTNPLPPTTVADRRIAVKALLNGYNSPTKSNFEDTLVNAGLDVVVEHQQFNSFVAGSLVGDPITEKEWKYVWSLYMIGVDGEVQDELLKYLIGLTYPLHTQPVFFIAKYDWTARTSGVATGLNDGIYEFGLYITAGDSGVLLTSPDCETWTARTSQVGSSVIQGLVTNGTVLLLFGSGGKLSSSTDGINWILRTSGFGANYIFDGIYAEYLFLIVGASGSISTSSDGLFWTAQTAAGGYSDSFYAAIYDIFFGKYIIAGQTGEVQNSSDASTWSSRTSQFGTTSIYCLCYGKGVSIAGGGLGKLSISTDGGDNWAAKTSQFGTSAIRKIIFVDDVFIAIGEDGKISKSTDYGATWVLKTSGTSVDFWDISYQNELIVVVGGVLATSSVVVVSNDLGETWNVMDLNVSNKINFVGEGKYKIFCGGEGGILSSTNYGELL